LICQQEDHWAYTGGKLDIIPIPDTLNQLLSTRLSRLKDIERLALQHGSIFGRKFWEGGLEALGSAGVQSILEQLQKTNLVENEAVSLLEGQKEWRFYHDLLQQAAYDSILKRQRKELHRLAEKWLELQLHKIGRLDEFAGQLALHAEKAGINDVASTWYLSAGKNAFQRCAMVEARAFFDRALELARPTDQEQIWNIISARQDIFARMGEMQAWQADVETLLELARKSAKNLWLAEAFYLYGFYQGVSGNLETELQCYQQGLEAARQAQNPRLECDNLMVKVTCLTRLGRMEEAGAVVTEALSLARSLKIEELLVRVLINASVYYIDAGRLDTAEQLLNEEVEVSRRTRDRWMHCVGLINLGYIYYLLGQYEISRSVLAESLELAKSINMRRESSYARLNLALCYFRLNDLKTTTKILESTADEVEILEDPIGQGVCHSYSGLVQEAYGAHAAALDCFQKAARILKKAGASGYELDAMAGQARCCAALNRAGEALSYANQLWFRLQAGASGLEFPVLAYETCANTLIQFDQHPLALPVIQKGYCELMARAARIEDPVWHASYLRNVVEHGRLVLLWQKICQ